MNPEREIINFWLGNSGYFTLSSIPLENNRLIDIIAVKISSGKIERIAHIETACAISSMDNMPAESYAQKFNDPKVSEKIKEIVSKSFGTDASYDKVLVIGNTSREEDYKRLDGIRIIKFENVLLDVLERLNRQNYRDETIRTLQLVKSLILSKPDAISEILCYDGEEKFLTQHDREVIIKSIMGNETTRKILSKPSMEHHLAAVLSESTLSQPQRLATAIEARVLTKRAKKKFEKLILASQEQKIKVKAQAEIREPKEKSLSTFFEN